ncbi:MAG: methyltransferase domain-containing protein, partial [Polyangiales bacterium]
MAPVDWKAAWKAGRTPWDEGQSPPALRRLAREGRIPAGRILVPGCGTGYDLATLAREDRHVIGLDLSPEARDAFHQAHADLPGRVDYRVADFFTFSPDEPIDFVWDYTFLVALDPPQRAAWGEVMARVVRADGWLATLLFPYADPISDREGPPWPINEGSVEDVIGDAFMLSEVREEPETHSGREGKERLALWR